MAKSKRRASSCVQFKASGDCKLPCGWVNSVKRRPHCRMRRSSKKDSMYRTPSRSNLTNATTRSNQSKRSNRSDRSTDSVVFNSISRKLFQSASPQSSLSGSTSPPLASPKPLHPIMRMKTDAAGSKADEAARKVAEFLEKKKKASPKKSPLVLPETQQAKRERLLNMIAKSKAALKK
jgi:hypothetical protein